MSKVNKQHELTLDLNPRTRSRVITNTTFFSMDVETAQKVIRFTHRGGPVNLADCMVTLGFEFVDAGVSKIIDSSDGSVRIEDAEAGVCSVVLPNHLYAYEGQVLVHVYLMFADGRSLDCGVVVTEFERSWLEGEQEEIEATYVKRFSDLARAVEARGAEILAEADTLLDQVRAKAQSAEALRGPQGEQGVAGPQGAPGIQGERGEAGPAGPTGALIYRQHFSKINQLHYDGSLSWLFSMNSRMSCC